MTSLANMMDTSAKVARSSAETAAKEEIVPKPLPADVLFGRDKIMFNHVGNIRFRLLIQARAKEYEFAPQRRVKSSIVYDVVQNVHGYGGRFLKREDGLWKVVGVTEAIQKVSPSADDYHTTVGVPVRLQTLTHDFRSLPFLPFRSDTLSATRSNTITR